MENCTFAPKLNKKAKIRKPEASIVVQNYYTTMVSARRGKKPTLINKDLLTEQLMKQEKDKKDLEKLERRAAKALKKRGSKSKEKKKDSQACLLGSHVRCYKSQTVHVTQVNSEYSKSVSDFDDEDDDSEEVEIAIGMRIKEAFANSVWDPLKKKIEVKESAKDNVKGLCQFDE